MKQAKRAKPGKLPTLPASDAIPALELAEKLRPPPGAPCEPIYLSRNERHFLVNIINIAAQQALYKPPPRSKNHDRDFWIAMDFYTRGKTRDRAKLVAKSWLMRETTVASIASRNQKHVREMLPKHPDEFWRRSVSSQLERYLQLRKPVARGYC